MGTPPRAGRRCPPTSDTARRSRTCPTVGFHRPFEPVQAGRPQVGEEVAQRRHAVRVDQVQPTLAVASYPDESGLAQHLEVQGDGLLGDVEVFGDLGHRPRFVADQAQDRTPVRFGEGLEGAIGRHHHHYAVTGAVIQATICTSCYLYINLRIALNSDQYRRPRCPRSATPSTSPPPPSRSGTSSATSPRSTGGPPA